MQQLKSEGSGYALCVVNLADTTYNATEDVYEWQLTNVRKIKAFPIKGKLNFFDVDEALIHYPGEKVVEEQNSRSSTNHTTCYFPNARYAEDD